MLIQINEIGRKETTYGELGTEDIFELLSGQEVYVKTDEIKFGDYLSMRLSSAQMYGFKDSMKVIHILTEPTQIRRTTK